MNRTQSIIAAATATTFATGAATGALVQHLRARPRPSQAIRKKSRGCHPIHSAYVEGPVELAPVTGEAQGIALVLLRERHKKQGSIGTPVHEVRSDTSNDETFSDIVANMAMESDAPTVVSIETDYQEALRSLADFIVALAGFLADEDLGLDGHECHNSDCPSNASETVRHVLREQAVVNTIFNLAHSFERVARNHVRSCRKCRRAGEYNDHSQAAAFLRDIAEHRLNRDTVLTVTGIPTVIAFNMVQTMMEAIERDSHVTIAEQMNYLNDALIDGIIEDGHPSMGD